MARTLPWIALALAAALTGCPDGSPGPDATAPDGARPDTGTQDSPLPPGVEVDLGTGQSYWTELPPTGAETELIHGPQGGYHIFGRVRFRGMQPDVLVSFQVTPAEGGPSLTDHEELPRIERRGLVRTEQGFESSSPELVILTRIRGPTEVVGRRFTLSVTLRERASGRVASASRAVTIVDND
ncbi:MAG: hypothetical protein HY909_23585 [Deltaproteobacteria bacterium]|nr:hypothetical protein [Deltaproteobacteria bacterium]